MNPQDYAEGIIRVCESFLSAPVECVAGVTGSNLTRRMESILSYRAVLELGVASKIMLGLLTAVALAVPLLAGIGRGVIPLLPFTPLPAARPPIERPRTVAPRVIAQTVAPVVPVSKPREPQFEVASVRPSDPDARGMSVNSRNGSLTARGATLRFLIRLAFARQGGMLLDGQLTAPSWLDEARYDINAKGPEDTASGEEKRMLQNLLLERFRIQMKWENTERTVYEVHQLPTGHKLQIVDDPAPVTERPPSGLPTGTMIRGEGGGGFAAGTADVTGDNVPRGMTFSGQSVGLTSLINYLSGGLGRPVIDKTGISQRVKYTLKGFQWPNSSSDLPSIFTVMQEQLGLRLEASRGLVEMLVIEKADRVPIEN